MEKCPFAVYDQNTNLLLCKARMTDGVDYSIAQNATQVPCAHQRFCNCKQRIINTDKARECYEHQLAKRNNNGN